MKWFRELFFKQQFKKVADQLKDTSKHKPSRKLCEELLMHLSEDRFMHYRSSAGLGVSVVSHYSSIDEYTKKIKEVNLALKYQQLLSPEWGNVAEKELSIDRFLVSADGYYLTDMAKAVSQFKEAGLQLCLLMEVSDTETSGLHEHNLRMLTKLFVNLRDVASKLIEVSFNN